MNVNTCIFEEYSLCKFSTKIGPSEILIISYI